MGQPVETRRARSEGREPTQGQWEYVYEEDAGDERRHADAEDRERHGRTVEELSPLDRG